MVSQQARPAVALFHILLLLSASPLDARRLIQTNQAGAKAGSQDLSVAETIDTANVAEGMDSSSEWWRLSCSKLQKSFDRRAGKLEVIGAKNELKEQGKMPAKTAIKSAIKLNRMAQGMKKAASMNCTWVEEPDVSTNQLLNFAGSSVGHSLCTAKAKQMIQDATNASEAVQSQVFMNSIAVMMSEDCEPPSPSEEPVPCDADCIAKEEDDIGQMESTVEEDEAASALMQLESNSTEATEFIEPVSAMFLGLIAIMLTIALCWITTMLLVLVIGVILCLIKSMFIVILNLFKKDKKKLSTSPKRCMYFWLNAVTGFRSGDKHWDKQGPAVILGACVAPHILYTVGLGAAPALVSLNR